MRYLYLIFLAFNFGFAQTDHNGNPVFISVLLNEETINDYVFSPNYYTLANNIDNSGSSVYISEKPTLDEIEQAAINLPSYHFTVLRNRAVVTMIGMTPKPKLQYLTRKLVSGKQKTFESKLKGDMPEARARELIKASYDPNAKISGDELFFNNKKFKIIFEKDIFQDVRNLIVNEKLNEGPVSEMIIPSQKELKEFILAESKDGGKLDFFTEIKGHEFDGVQIKPGVFSTKYSVALYRWGRANFDVGINTLDDVYLIWAEHSGKVVGIREKEYLKMGFYKELER